MPTSFSFSSFFSAAEWNKTVQDHYSYSKVNYSFPFSFKQETVDNFGDHILKGVGAVIGGGAITLLTSRLLSTYAGTKIIPIQHLRWRSMMSSAINNNVEALSKLPYTVNVNVPDISGNTIYHYSVINGSFKAATEILARNPNLYARNDCGRTPLYEAASKGSLRIIQEIELNIKDRPQFAFKESLVAEKVMADENHSYTRSEDGFKNLMNIPSYKGWTPLCSAIVYNHTATATYLIQKGANTSHENKDGHTALFWAIKRENIPLVMTLIEKDPDFSHVLTMRAKDGGNVFHLIAKTNNKQIFKCFARRMCEANKKEGLRQLLSHKAGYAIPINSFKEDRVRIKSISDRFGRTPIHEACAYGRIDFIEGVLELEGKIGSLFDIKQVSSSGRDCIELIGIFGGFRKVEEKEYQAVGNFNKIAARIIPKLRPKYEEEISEIDNSIKEGLSFDEKIEYLLRKARLLASILLMNNVKLKDDNKESTVTSKEEEARFNKRFEDNLTQLLSIGDKKIFDIDQNGYSILHYTARFDSINMIKKIILNYKKIVSSDQKDVTAFCMKHGSRVYGPFIFEACIFGAKNVLGACLESSYKSNNAEPEEEELKKIDVSEYIVFNYDLAQFKFQEEFSRHNYELSKASLLCGAMYSVRKDMMDIILKKAESTYKYGSQSYAEYVNKKSFFEKTPLDIVVNNFYKIDLDDKILLAFRYGNKQKSPDNQLDQGNNQKLCEKEEIKTFQCSAEYEYLLKITELLLIAGAKINTISKPNKEEELHSQKEIKNANTDSKNSFFGKFFSQNVLQNSKKLYNPHNKETMMHVAARQNSHKLLELLIRYGGNSNQVDAFLSTPLHYAVLNGNMEAVKVLVEDGASAVFATNEDGMRPYDLSLRFPQIRDYLRQKMIDRSDANDFRHQLKK